MEQTKNALVLAGGGSRGAYQVGVWQALAEMDYPIDIVTGTSVGSLNGALIAQGDIEVAFEMWRTLETQMVFEININEEEAQKNKTKAVMKAYAHEFLSSGGAKADALKKVLNDHLDEEKIRSSPIEYGLVTVELPDFKPHYLFKQDIPEERLIDFMLASCAIYPAVQTYKIDNVNYLDGAFADNLPIEMALKKGATSIIAVDLEAFGFTKKSYGANDTIIRYIRSYWDLGKTLIFDTEQTKKSIRLGYLDTLKLFDVYEGYAYTFIKGEIKKQCAFFNTRLTMTLNTCGIYLDITPKRMAEKRARETFIKFIYGRKQKKVSNRSILSAAAELAGELLEVSPTFIYSIEHFNKKILESYYAHKRQRQDQQYIATMEARNFFNLFREKLSQFDRVSRMIYIAELLQHNIKSENPRKLLYLALLSVKEFTAAIYLSLLLEM